jgi:serine/threonine protein kinase
MKPKDMIFESTFATYRGERQIGSGGAGTVVKVVDDAGDDYAIKFLSPRNLTSEKVKRFKNELFFCMKSQHPNILKVLDHGRVDVDETKCPFYVMPLYQSGLNQLMQTGIRPSDILRLFSQILDGVEAAHLQRVHHRDIKPENILHDPHEERLVVADFGIARFAESELHTLVETKPATRLANFQYAAPEQREKGMQVDHRADIFSLGLILNQMFTGKLATGVGFTRIADVHSDSSYLDDLVDAMLMQDASKRPPDIAAIKRELIGRKQSFVTEQKLSALKGTVIPKSEVEDPLVDNPPHITAVRWENSKLIFTLSQQVNADWARCFQNPGSHTSILGHGPEYFQIRGNTATVASDERTAQAITDHTKNYVQMANQNYKNLVEQAFRRRQQEEETKLQRQIQSAERTKAVNASLKL